MNVIWVFLFCLLLFELKTILKLWRSSLLAIVERLGIWHENYIDKRIAWLIIIGTILQLTVEEPEQNESNWKNRWPLHILPVHGCWYFLYFTANKPLSHFCTCLRNRGKTHKQRILPLFEIKSPDCRTKAGTKAGDISINGKHCGPSSKPEVRSGVPLQKWIPLFSGKVGWRHQQICFKDQTAIMCKYNVQYLEILVGFLRKSYIAVHVIYLDNMHVFSCTFSCTTHTCTKLYEASAFVDVWNQFNLRGDFRI